MPQSRVHSLLLAGLLATACGRTPLDPHLDASLPSRDVATAGETTCTWRFAATASYAAGPAPVAVAVGDFDGDGHPDLVVSNYAGGPDGLKLNTLRNLGSGTFAPWKSYTSTVSFSLVTGNFAASPAIDVVAGCDLFANTGGGSFADPVDYGSFCGFQDSDNNLVADDFDGDGRSDFAWARGNTVGVYLQRSGGQFDEVETSISTLSPYITVMASADFDRDGHPDLVVGSWGYGNPSFVKILRNTGSGTFTEASAVADFGAPQTMAAGDFNGDGWPDLAVSDATLGLRILLNQGDGTLALSATYPIGWDVRSIAVGDLDGDGDFDVAYADYGVWAIGMWMNNGDGTFASPALSRSLTSSPWSVALADLNGDGHLDIAAAAASTSDINEVDVILSECR